MLEIKKLQNFYVLDENLNNSFISGNKFRKIRGILTKAGNISGILTFGSPWSSHLLVCAWFARLLQIPFVGIVLAENKIVSEDYPHLRMAKLFGAQLFLSKISDASHTIDNYKVRFDNFFWIPGGAHTLEAANAYETFFDELFHENLIPPDVKNIILPFGTGTTAYGIWKAIIKANKTINIIGVSVSRRLSRCISALEELEGLKEFPNLVITDRFAGRYGERDVESEKYRWKFFKESCILPDPIYNSKAVQFLYENRLQNTLVINTGGMLNNLL